jgi:tRNA-specific 2-thiouridylase
MVLKVKDLPGPLVVIPGGSDEAMVMLAAGICTGYSKAPNGSPAWVTVQVGESRRQVTVLGIPPGECKRYML